MTQIDKDSYEALLERHAVEIKDVEAKIVEAQAREDFALYEKLMGHMAIIRDVHEAERQGL